MLIHGENVLSMISNLEKNLADISPEPLSNVSSPSTIDIRADIEVQFSLIGRIGRSRNCITLYSTTGWFNCLGHLEYHTLRHRCQGL
jgi:hypothetical protein